MMALPNLSQTVFRWMRPSTILLAAMALAFFGPGVWDRHVRPRPWVTATMEVRTGADGLTIVDSVTYARYRVTGKRYLWMEDRAGRTLCTASRLDSWQGERRRPYTLTAFFEHKCDVPTMEWRACWEFDVETDLGTRATFPAQCSRFQPGERPD